MLLPPTSNPCSIVVKSLQSAIKQTNKQKRPEDEDEDGNENPTHDCDDLDYDRQGDSFRDEPGANNAHAILYDDASEDDHGEESCMHPSTQEGDPSGDQIIAESDVSSSAYDNDTDVDGIYGDIDRADTYSTSHDETEYCTTIPDIPVHTDLSTPTSDMRLSKGGKTEAQPLSRCCCCLYSRTVSL